MEKLADIGVFGGSGFYKFLDNVEEVKKDVEEAVAKHRGETDEDTDIK